ncbi:ABC transporter ATP-binding protein [Rhodococcus rhodnii]|uniref:Nickel import system ATP-binding protein NikD n=2 Tax=Rhodococcus rhodnii TaxID=38312 RepID=R7WID7_9NOCA|nr:ABC transporter ATP-binding protein [Rhodococcus rhodnii]EOM74951.1 ABC dipeptide transporter [Rhodococcus rhodnii LMG 5362]TXG89417.1 ABC transporter ATP-binding protein [Rhodococcus rhodnii]
MTSLNLEGLSVRIATHAGDVPAVSDVSLTVAGGSVHALVGESGCGKSVLAHACLGLLPASARVDGRVHVTDRTGCVVDLRDDAAAARARGGVVALVPQSAATHLTPVRTVGSQIAETAEVHGSGHAVAGLLARVGLPPNVAELYPHELSGGMSARVAVACALAGDPDVLVADEPTASLDPAAAQAMTELLVDCASGGAAVLVVTHDLARVHAWADAISVMYAGRIVETGPAAAVLGDPWHDYTRALLAALPANGLRPMPGSPPDLTALAQHGMTDECVYHLRDPATTQSGGPTALRWTGMRAVRTRVLA